MLNRKRTLLDELCAHSPSGLQAGNMPALAGGMCVIQGRQENTQGYKAGKSHSAHRHPTAGRLFFLI